VPAEVWELESIEAPAMTGQQPISTPAVTHDSTLVIRTNQAFIAYPMAGFMFWKSAIAKETVLVESRKTRLIMAFSQLVHQWLSNGMRQTTRAKRINSETDRNASILMKQQFGCQMNPIICTSGMFLGLPTTVALNRNRIHRVGSLFGAIKRVLRNDMQWKRLPSVVGKSATIRSLCDKSGPFSPK
jgi:hypothetical protein